MEAITISSNPSSWVVRPRQNREARLRLFCFPYAGGSASIYRTWPRDLPPDVEVCAVQLPGRGGRLPETPFTDLRPLVRALTEALLPQLETPFAFFGHSMGALIAFEFARHLHRQYGLRPAHLFVSGFRAAQIPDPDAPTYNLPDAELLAAVRRLNGTPEAVLQNDELLRLMLPVVRADVTICETYGYQEGPPLDCPVTAFGGRSDSIVSPEELAAWIVQTSGDYDMQMFDGDHFYINSARPQLLRAVSATLTRHLSRLPEYRCAA
jgi:medium-chain acyl-[acyl-carrier-protein] hydrolase